MAPGKDPLGLIGQTFDSLYRIDALAGEGGFSSVYRGTHAGLGEPIAVKCLRLQALQSSLDHESEDRFTRRFRDEGRIMYRLSQGNLDIVRCITHSTVRHPTNGMLIPYMALEWLDGRSLGADLRDRRAHNMGGRPLKEVVALFEPGALAIDYAHRNGVVHRDVKPGNLFLNRGADGRVRMKVLDFGMAKVIDETIGITMVATSAGFMAVSPRYAAPEQFSNQNGPVGPWTDVYSLTMVMLEALSGRKVRKSEGLAACMVEALDRDAQPTPRSLGIDLPPSVEHAMARALAIDSTRRPQSIVELWADVERGSRVAVSVPVPAAGPVSSTTVMAAPMTEPPSTGAPTFASTVVISDRPAPPAAVLGSTMPLGGPKVVPATMALGPQARVAAAGTSPVATTMVVAPSAAPSAPASAPQVPAVQTRPPSRSRPRRGALAAAVLVLVAAVLMCAAVVAWYAWHRHHLW